MEENNPDLKLTKAQPEILPKPTYWPFFLAIGILFLGWGLLAGWPFAVGGGIVFIISIIGWINNLRNEQ